MDNISIEPKPKWIFWTIFLLVLAVCVAFSTTIWVFSFYTLLHWQKVLVLGCLMVVFGLSALRFLLKGYAHNKILKRRLITALAFAIGLTMVFVDQHYHMAPIRTVHTLEITNLSEQVDITLNYIQFSDGTQLDLINQFPGFEYQGEKIILKPGQSLVYSREMVGGLEISSHASRGLGHLSVIWDNDGKTVDVGEKKITTLPAWSWGEPSLIYRALGLVSVFTDIITIAGFLFCIYWFPGLTKIRIPENSNTPISIALRPFTIPILIGFGLTFLAIINQLWITKNITYSLALMLAGVASFIPTFFAQHRKWVMRAALPLILLGIFFNIYVFISPINELHLTPEILTDDSLAKLAQKAGDSTYLSMGYYRYFRNTTIHIPADLMAELNLFTDRLERMNTGLQVSDSPYDYELTADVADWWLAYYDWQAWPREVGGTYYLSTVETSPGDELYFFQSGDRYFLVSIDFLLESGMTDVSILN